MPHKNDQTNKKEKRNQAYEKSIHENWHVQHKKGKWAFVLRFGILTWGVTTFVVYWLLLTVLNWIAKVDQPLISIQTGISFLIFMVFGVGYGLFIWRRNERIYLKKFPYGK